MPRSAGLLDVPPQFLETRELQFETGCDQLDYYRAIGLELASGRRVALWWYERAPEPRGLDVQVDSGDDVDEVRTELLAALKVDEARVIWTPGQGHRGWEGRLATIYLVIRRDGHPTASPCQCVVREALFEEAVAQAEARRLNDVNADKDVVYDVQSTWLKRRWMGEEG